MLRNGSPFFEQNELTDRALSKGDFSMDIRKNPNGTLTYEAK